MNTLHILDALRKVRGRLPGGQILHRLFRSSYYRALEWAFPRGFPIRLSSGEAIRLHPRLLGMRPEQYEVRVAAILAEEARYGAIVLDIGAHVGLHTLMLSRRVGSAGRVLAVEASPANARLLRAHLGWNQCSNVQVVEKAIGDREADIMFHFRPNPTDSGAFANSLAYDIEGESAIVRMTTIDRICAGFRPDLIKIDIEGAEFKAILGAQETLARAAPTLCIAFHPEAMRKMGTEPSQLVSLLDSWQYEGRHLDGRLAIEPGFEEILFRKRAASR